MAVKIITAFDIEGDFLNKYIENSNLKTIEEGAFGDCVNLENINLPKSLEKINRFAFQSCPNLKSIEIPESTKVEDEAFDDISILQYENEDMEM